MAMGNYYFTGPDKSKQRSNIRSAMCSIEGNLKINLLRRSIKRRDTRQPFAGWRVFARFARKRPRRRMSALRKLTSVAGSSLENQPRRVKIERLGCQNAAMVRV